MESPQATITIHIEDGQFFTNASFPDGSFICTTAQSTLDMSLASAMPFIRKQIAKIEAVEDPPVEDPNAKIIPFDMFSAYSREDD